MILRTLAIAAAACTFGALANDVPDLSKTPGVARAGLTKAKICSIKWGKDERHVTDAMKRQVFESYGFTGK